MGNTDEIVDYMTQVQRVGKFYKRNESLAPEIKELLGEIKIEEATYWTVKVSFSQEGGGEDYQDEYRYWINQDTYEIDYLAYNYNTDEGGIRFRKAINKKRVKGILFQDYQNFRPLNKFESLDNLPQIYEEGLLSQISLIENKNIIVQ